MLTESEAKSINDQMNAHAREIVKPFVMRSADLPPDRFETAARAYLEETLDRTLDRQGDKLDELDMPLFERYWRQMWALYYEHRAAGASMSGRA